MGLSRGGKGEPVLGVAIDGTIQPVGTGTSGGYVAVEVKRHATIEAVEQLTRYLEFLGRDARLCPIRGVIAAQSIAPQAVTLANDRGIKCVVVDYEALKANDTTLTLF